MSLAVKLKMRKMKGALMPLQYHTEVGRLGGNGARGGYGDAVKSGIRRPDRRTGRTSPTIRSTSSLPF